MTAQPPLLLADNVFDAITQYGDATVTVSSETLGREGRRVACYRQDRQWWQPLDDGTANTPQGNWVRSTLTAARPTSAGFISRGHNLWGKTLVWEGSTNGGTSWTVSLSRTVPVLNGDGSLPVGGDPTTGVAVTEEGALWCTWAQTTACADWRLRIGYTASFIPVVPTAILGLAYQVSGFCHVFDDDAMDRKLASDESDAGWLAAGTVYAWRVAELQLALIGATEYDTQIRALRTLLFRRNVPALLCWDWGTHPERAALFRFDKGRWSFATQKVYRNGTLPLREHYPKTTY